MTSTRPLIFWAGISALAFGLVLSSQQEAKSLANPNRTGRNVAVKATTTFHRVPAYGTNCAVTIINTNNEVLCTGYAKARSGDGGPYGLGFTMIADGGVNCANSIDICGSSALGCISNNIVRDTVPDSIWYGMKSLSSDGGTFVRFELSSGCEIP